MQLLFQVCALVSLTKVQIDYIARGNSSVSVFISVNSATHENLVKTVHYRKEHSFLSKLETTLLSSADVSNLPNFFLLTLFIIMLKFTISTSFLEKRRKYSYYLKENVQHLKYGNLFSSHVTTISSFSFHFTSFFLKPYFCFPHFTHCYLNIFHLYFLLRLP